MRRAILVIALVAAATAEAPYRLPRPASVFNYVQPAPPPSPHLSLFPRLPQPHTSLVFNAQPSYSQSGYNYVQPHQQVQQRHQTQFHHVATQPASQLYSVNYPRPQQIYQQPSFSYRQPQIQPSLIYAPQIPVEHIRPLPALVATQQQAPIAYYQQQQLSTGKNYSYQQSQSRPYVSQLPLQSQSLNNFPSSSLSSYEADSKQYNAVAQVQPHSDALDSTVVNQVQNIIKQTEHTSAKEAGFLSLVSGVTLENVKPSIEITSFIQNSPLPISSAVTSSSSHSSVGASNSSGAGSSSQAFLPLTQPASSYGSPN